MVNDKEKGEARPKILSPTLRPKKRYLAYEIVSERVINFDDLVQGFWFACLNFLGELGTSRALLWVPKDLYIPEIRRGLIKCAHTEVENVRTALSLIERIGDSRVIVNILGVTGTMKSARAKYFSPEHQKSIKEFGE